MSHQLIPELYKQVERIRIERASKLNDLYAESGEDVLLHMIADMMTIIDQLLIGTSLPPDGFVSMMPKRDKDGGA